VVLVINVVAACGAVVDFGVVVTRVASITGIDVALVVVEKLKGACVEIVVVPVQLPHGT